MEDGNRFATEFLNRPSKDDGFCHAGEFYSFAASHGMIAKVDVVALENTIFELNQLYFENKIFVNIH